jgi:membrane protein implicated in regulation of membrane protease activity
MGIVFLTTGTVLLAASVLTRSLWLVVVTNVVVGIQVERAGPPAGVINITLGLLLLLVLWNRRQRRNRERPETAGAKSRALRDALARHMRDLAIPDPA